MSLYNCKCDGDQYRISKFTNDLDVEASYLTDGAECDCPAGHRPVCRHRIMLVRFIAKNATAGQWFHNYEHDQWIRAAIAEGLNEVDEDDIEIFEPTARYADGLPLQAGMNAKDITPKPINLLELAKPSAEPYGISPMIIQDLPIIKAHNEATHERLVRAEQTRILPKPLRRL